MPVHDDPREWSSLRKNATLVLIAFASMVAALAANIQNPAVAEMEADLPATSSQFSLSISLYILVQGLFPLVWSAISEVKGRKLVYVFSLSLFTIGSIVVAVSKHIEPVIGFRCLQAAGSSAVTSIGSATLADIFDPSERGRKMGVYYVAALIGPSLGPIFGGVLTTVFGWRAIFWFLTIIAGACWISFVVFYRDTFRCERSLTYQNLLRKRLRSATPLSVSRANTKASKSGGINCLKSNTSDITIDIEKSLEKEVQKDGQEDIKSELPTITLTLRDVNPLKPLLRVLRRKNNVCILLSSGLLYSFAFLLPYATSRRLANSYGFNPLKIGLVTITVGAGSVFGSVLGGWWSDRALRRLKEANGGVSYPEMRLRSTIAGLIVLPPFVLGFGWLCHLVHHLAPLCVFLFFGGFFNIWIYASTLAYVVDANAGRSSTAVAANSAFRGVFAFMSIEAAVPLQDNLGDGGMYSVFAGLLLINSLIILLLWWKGAQWREEAEAYEKERALRSDTVASINVGKP
ncbi:MFS general substrate transporter [Agrocybe pediades]|nr:MFS general substrate transporter [Agrocybe pediades]